jgi:hypothetical protein
MLNFVKIHSADVQVFHAWGQTAILTGAPSFHLLPQASRTLSENEERVESNTGELIRAMHLIIII